MLITSKIIVPFLLLLLSWYSIAVALRALGEFIFRWGQNYFIRSRMKKLEQAYSQTSSPENGVVETSQPSRTETYLRALQEEIESIALRANQAGKWKVRLLLFEGLFFTIMAVSCFYASTELIERLQLFWWLHLVGIVIFLCFLTEARRILIFFPLALSAWLLWEAFSFIGSFERTLDATSELVRVQIIDKRETSLGKKLTVKLSFPHSSSVEVKLLANKKLYFEGRVLRVSSSVLLFGGRNLASIERVFSDDIPSKNAISILKSEEIPLHYRWKEEENSFRNEVRKRFAYLLWTELFALHKQQENTTKQLVQVELLEAAICPPPRPKNQATTSDPQRSLDVGDQFSVKLRHVGGIECHQILQPTTQQASP